MRPLIDPRLRFRIPEAWPSRCTIQQEKMVSDASGQQSEGPQSSVAGLANIECRIGPIIDIRPTDSEIRSGGVIEQYARRNCKLNGYFPQIIPRGMWAIVDGESFPIRGVEHDSQKFSTRLHLEVITV